jgi:hypothetical protein
VSSDDHKKAVLEATYQSAQTALRTTITINVAAIAAILAFVGPGKVTNHGRLAIPVALFALGVVLGALGTIAAYVANFGYLKSLDSPETWWRRLDHGGGWIAFLLAVAAVSLFAVGMGCIWWNWDQLQFARS